MTAPEPAAAPPTAPPSPPDLRARPSWRSAKSQLGTGLTVAAAAVAFVPLALRYLDSIRTAAERTHKEIAIAAVLYGAAFGFLFLSYSGWFQWAAPGLIVAALIVFPWRAGPRKGLALLGLTGAMFLLIVGRYLARLLFDPAAKIADNYIYFDVHTEPMYIAMFRNDTPGPVGMWPPLGELGGVGLFMIVLLAGLGIALVLGRRTTLMIGLGAIMLGAWLMRFYFARLLWDTKLVQLYPRTTPVILYSMLIATGLAVAWLIQRVPSDSPIRRPPGLIGAVCALLLLFCSVGSATSDRFMPSNTDPPGAGWLTWSRWDPAVRVPWAATASSSSSDRVSRSIS